MADTRARRSRGRTGTRAPLKRALICQPLAAHRLGRAWSVTVCPRADCRLRYSGRGRGRGRGRGPGWSDSVCWRCRVCPRLGFAPSRRALPFALRRESAFTLARSIRVFRGLVLRGGRMKRARPPRSRRADARPLISQEGHTRTFASSSSRRLRPSRASDARFKPTPIAFAAPCPKQKTSRSRTRSSAASGSSSAQDVSFHHGGGVGLSAADVGGAGGAKYYQLTRNMTDAVDLTTAIILGGRRRDRRHSDRHHQRERSRLRPGLRRRARPIVCRFAFTEVATKRIRLQARGPSQDEHEGSRLRRHPQRPRLRQRSGRAAPHRLVPGGQRRVSQPRSLARSRLPNDEGHVRSAQPRRPCAHRKNRRRRRARRLQRQRGSLRCDRVLVGAIRARVLYI
jgi:hypothetical protein